MLRRVALVTGVFAAVILAPDAASAQFDLTPRGIIGAVTRPLRDLLGHRHGHRIIRRHHKPANEARTAASQESPSANDRSQPGTLGTLLWPDAYTDVVGYVFWPDDYGRKIQQHGFRDIALIVTGPLPSRRPATVGVATQEPDQIRTTSNGENKRNDDRPLALPCADETDDKSNWPAAPIEQAIKLSNSQHDVLGKLLATYAGGVKTIKADCRDITGLPPTKRLEAMEQQLWAVRDAGVLIREPLKRFYESLTDEQKDKFRTARPENPREGGKAAATAMSRRQQACFAQESDDMGRFLKQIQQTVRPTEKQRASFDALRKKSSDMAKLLAVWCLQPTPAAPLERLDAADTRLTAMNYAATTVDIALNDLYGQLSDAQKARFDALGR